MFKRLSENQTDVRQVHTATKKLKKKRYLVFTLLYASDLPLLSLLSTFQTSVFFKEATTWTAYLEKIGQVFPVFCL